jgi:hypothetical protein
MEAFHLENPNILIAISMSIWLLRVITHAHSQQTWNKANSEREEHSSSFLASAARLDEPRSSGSISSLSLG